MLKQRKYIVSTRFVDKYSKQLHWRDPIYEFNQKLSDEINLRELAYMISIKLFEREFKFFKSVSKDDIFKMVIERQFCKVEEFRLNSFSFGVTDDETLGDYVRIDNNKKLKLEVFLVVQWEIQLRPQEISQDLAQKKLQWRQQGFFFDETLSCVVPRDQAPGFIAKMKPGLVIVADCTNCNKKVIRQVKLFKNRTATFNLKQGMKCPKCSFHLSDLDSPYLTECEYNYQGEKSDGQVVYNFGWKTVQANHILYFKEEEQQNIDWIELKIFIRVFDTRYCTACQQKLEGDNEKDIEDNCFKGQCGHRYHTTCFKQVSKYGEGYCVAEGCYVKFPAS